MAEIDRIEIGRKAADGTLTIGEAMSVRTGSAAKTILNRVKALGYSLNDNWATVSTDKFLRELQDIGSSSNFVELGATEQILAKLAAQSEEGAEYKYKFGYGAGGRANQLELSKNKQPRGTSEAGKGVIKFDAVPPGKQSLPAIVEGINAISENSVVLNAEGKPTKTKLGPKADQIRDALVVNLMIPLRPGEIRKIGIDDINFETGRFSDRFQRVNKIRNPVEIDEVLLEILRDARDRAVANGQSVLFDITDTQLLNGVRVQGGIMEKMRPYEGILGRPFKNAMDVRKIVPSLMHGELKAGIELSQIMGHETYDAMMGGLKKMTAARYVSPVVSDEGSAVKGVMRAYRNYMAETLGIKVLNDLPSKLGVTASRLEIEGAPKFAVVPTGGDIAPGPDGTRIGQVTAEDAEVVKQNRATNLAQSRLAETQAESQRLDLLKDMPAKERAAIEADETRRFNEKNIRAEVRARLTGEEGDTVPQSDPEARARLEGRGFNAKGLADAINKYLGKAGKAVGAAAVFETARQFVEAPLETGAAIAREVAIEGAGLAARLPAGPAAALPMIMQPTAITSGEMTPEARMEAVAMEPANMLDEDTEDMERMAIADAGFVSRNREPEAAPASEAGFITR